jgi:hypothetical protein
LPVTRISSRKLDGIREWLLANNIPLTRENWIDINWFGEETEEDLEGEDENGEPIPPGKRQRSYHSGVEGPQRFACIPEYLFRLFMLHGTKDMHDNSSNVSQDIYQSYLLPTLVKAGPAANSKWHSRHRKMAF